MAIKLRCTECKKKLSVDEGFAGGVCRCPYCKAIVPVRQESKTRGVRGRPAAPTRRPAGPPVRAEAPAAARESTEVREEEIPLAKPVRIQGIVALVLLGLVVVMAGAVGFLLVRYGRGGGLAGPGTSDTGPLDFQIGRDGDEGEPLPAGPRVGSLQIEPPVIYCIATGSLPALDFAGLKTWESIQTLGADGKFGIVLCADLGNKFMGEGYSPANDEGLAKAREFFDEPALGSAAALAGGVQAALSRQPKTVVVFVSAAVPDADIDKVVSAADAAGAAVVTVILSSDQEVIEKMKQLSERPRAEGEWTNYKEQQFR